ncbi:MAG: ABC transporter permease, partial [Flavobacteriaceae bacterium]|nr:ABC transporter permease [Flavobacteriaceae bacterium]
VKGDQVTPNYSFLALYPVVILFMGMLSLGLGMIVSSLVTKYRDLSFLVSFGVQLLMYLSAVVYPISLAQEKFPEYAWVVEYNPLAYMIEVTRYILIGDGTVTTFGIVYTASISVVVLIVGLLIFNKTEKSFIDTI